MKVAVPLIYTGMHLCFCKDSSSNPHGRRILITISLNEALPAANIIIEHRMERKYYDG